MWKDDIDHPNVQQHIEERAKAAGMELNEYATKVYTYYFARVCVSSHQMA